MIIKCKNNIIFKFAINSFINSLYFLFFINQMRADDCIITNKTQIASQWLNNIICIGEKDFAYVNLVTFSKGDMIVETTAIPGSSKRKFYGIKSDGGPFFNNQEYNITIEVSGQHQPNNERYEGEIFIAHIGDREYLLSVPKGENRFAELYDFDNMRVESQVSVTTFLRANKILNSRSSAINFMKGNINYVLFSFIDYFDNSNQFSLKLLKFSSTDIKNSNPVQKNYTLTNSIGISVSCFVTDSNCILCLYLTKRLTVEIVDYFTGYIKIGIYNSVLTQITEKDTDYIMVQNSEKINFFLKCIHLEGNAGIFIFYKSSGTLKHTMDTYPTLLFKNYTGGSSLNDYLSSSVISLNKKEFNTLCLLNDLIKISNKKICFVSTSVNKDELIIVLLNIFNTNKVVIRYYSIDIFNLYTFKFFSQIRANPYNNYISFAFSFCRQNQCEDSNDPHYPAFIIFSYPNGTDYTLNINNYLFYNNDIKINDLQIDLKENVTIDNNIFGLVYSGIEINQIIECDNINLKSSLNASKYININYTLSENEKINITFNSLNTFTCIIKYFYIITEPVFTKFNSYATERVTTYGSDTANIFNNNEKNKYKSRVLTYTIELDNKLAINGCKNRNCELCLESNKNICITCKYNFTINDNIVKNKTCYIDQDLTEIQTTQIITSKTINSIVSTNIDNTKNAATTITQFDTNTQFFNTTQINSDTSNNEDSNFCTIDQIFNNECENIKMNSGQVSEIYDKLKNNMKTVYYNGTNKIIQTENVVFQLSTLEDQKNNEKLGISSIDLGKCQNILREKYNISNDDPLIILKTDIKSPDLSSTNVQYEIYEPYNFTLLNLVDCSNEKIQINVPVNLDEAMVSLYNSLNESGYNLFDSEDDFYNDICSIYTAGDGTDMILEDRRKEIYGSTENITICQSGCTFESYNVTNKKAKCNCDVQIDSTEIDINKIDFTNKNFIHSLFVDTLLDSNFLVLKCYKLALNLKDILKNKGRIIMTIILLLFLLLLFFYIIKDKSKINEHILYIMNNKNTFSKNIKKPKYQPNKNNIKLKTKDIKDMKNIKGNEKNRKKKKKKNLKKKKKKKKKKKNNNNNNLYSKKNKNKNSSVAGKKNVFKKSEPPKKIKVKPKNRNEKNKKIKIKRMNNKMTKNKYLSSGENLSNSFNKNVNLSVDPLTNLHKKTTKKKDSNTEGGSKKAKLAKNKKEKIIIKYINQINIFKNRVIKKDTKTIHKRSNNNFYKNLNDQELNTLEYNKAIIYDKRVYFQYYWSLLKKKQLILFTFLPINDYNLVSLKIALFLLSFSLYFTINGFFFSDETMHKIHEDKGAFNIFFQIPQILYSSVISAAINMILKLLSLSEKNILDLKSEKNIIILGQKSKKARHCLLSALLLLFFWYFISCFCAVYINTQDILIKDTFISFGLSMLYPFGLNLLPGFLRIPALRAKKKDKKCLYKISLLVALI